MATITATKKINDGMTTRELIELLQHVDPTGETLVRINDHGDLVAAVMAPNANYSCVSLVQRYECRRFIGLKQFPENLVFWGAKEESDSP